MANTILEVQQATTSLYSEFTKNYAAIRILLAFNVASTSLINTDAMAWDKKKYFRDLQAELRRKAKEYDKLMKESTINPNFGKELAAKRITELEQAGSRAKDMLKSAIDEQD